GYPDAAVCGQEPHPHRPDGESARANLRHRAKEGTRPPPDHDDVPLRGGCWMRRTRLAVAALGALLAALVVPAAALAGGSTLELFNQNKLPDATAINSIWVLVAGILVMFMQAGFAFLEIGFSRGKNVGTVVAKILVNFSIAALMFWAVGMAFAFGEGN